MKDLQIIQNDDGVFDVYDDTYDITIHCTSQEEQDEMMMKLNRTVCTDAISRKAVDKIINKWLSHPDYELKDGIYDMTKKIHKLPSVTPQPKTGHWIDHQEDRWIYAKCSECETVHDSRTNYCPHCGCKMQEVEHEADN